MVNAARILTFCLLSFLFISMASAQDWVSITDEIEVDYNTNMVRIFVVIKSNSPNYNHYNETLEPGIKLLSTYVKTLTVGNEKKTLADEMKARPALAAKIQRVLEENLRRGGDNGSYLQETGQFCRYYTFDLKKLLPLVPELNMPKPAGTVQ